MAKIDFAFIRFAYRLILHLTTFGNDFTLRSVFLLLKFLFMTELVFPAANGLDYSHAH